MSSHRFSGALVAVLALAAMIASATAFAGKQPSYSPTLEVTGLSGLQAATSTSCTDSGPHYSVAGGGYDSNFGGVTVVVYSPTAAAFAGQMPDSNGCISLSNFYYTFAAAEPGHYQIDAFQMIKGKRTKVASTSFDL